jgi:cytochrome c biogenesis protein ResB
MKKLSLYILIVLGILTIGCSVQASAQTRTSFASQSRASRKAAKKQQKAMKKYLKAQKKAQRKMIKKDRKNTKLFHRQS